MESLVGKTLLIAGILFRISEGLSNRRHLPTLLREKRLDDTLDEESTTNEPVDIEALSSAESKEKLIVNKYKRTSPESEPKNDENTEHFTSERIVKRKDFDDDKEDNGLKVLNAKLKSKEQRFKENIQRVSRKHHHQLTGKDDKIILPGMKFDVIHQESRMTSLAAPNKEARRQFRLNLRRKIRRRLKRSKMRAKGLYKNFEHEREEDISPVSFSDVKEAVKSSTTRVIEDTPKKTRTEPERKTTTPTTIEDTSTTPKTKADDTSPVTSSMDSSTARVIEDAPTTPSSKGDKISPVYSSMESSATRDKQDVPNEIRTGPEHKTNTPTTKGDEMSPVTPDLKEASQSSTNRINEGIPKVKTMPKQKVFKAQPARDDMLPVSSSDLMKAEESTTTRSNEAIPKVKTIPKQKIFKAQPARDNMLPVSSSDLMKAEESTTTRSNEAIPKVKTIPKQKIFKAQPARDDMLPVSSSELKKAVESSTTRVHEDSPETKSVPERKGFKGKTATKHISSISSSELKKAVEPSITQANKDIPNEISSLSSSRTSRLPKKFSTLLRTGTKTPSLLSLPKLKSQRSPTARSYIPLKDKKKKPTGYSSKPTLKRKKRLSRHRYSTNNLLDSSLKLSSTLQMTFKSPYHHESKLSVSTPTKGMEDKPSVRPLTAPDHTPSPTSLSEFPPSLKELPSDDLMMLNDFFNHAAVFKKKHMKGRDNPTKRQAQMLRSYGNRQEHFRENRLKDNYGRFNDNHREQFGHNQNEKLKNNNGDRFKYNSNQFQDNRNKQHKENHGYRFQDSSSHQWNDDPLNNNNNIHQYNDYHGHHLSDKHRDEPKGNHYQQSRNNPEEHDNENQRNQDFIKDFSDNKATGISIQQKESANAKDHESNLYAKELLEFQRKAIEAEEKRLDDKIKSKQPHHQHGFNRLRKNLHEINLENQAKQHDHQQETHQLRKNLHELDNQNQAKQHEVHELLEELGMKWKKKHHIVKQNRSTSQEMNPDDKDYDRNQEHDLFGDLSEKRKHRQNVSTKDSHNSRWNTVDSNIHHDNAEHKDHNNNHHDDNDNDNDEDDIMKLRKKGSKRRRRKMFHPSVGPTSSQETPTNIPRVDNDDDIVEMAFTPSRETFTPTPALVESNGNDVQGMEVAISETGKTLGNSTSNIIPTKRSKNNNRSQDYLKANSTVQGSSGERLGQIDRDKAKNVTGTGSNGDNVVYDNDDTIEDVETVDYDKDAPGNQSEINRNNTASEAGRGKVNDTANLHELKDNQLKDYIEDEHRQSHNNSDKNNGNKTNINGDSHPTNSSINNDHYNDNSSLYNDDNNNEEDMPHDERLLYILGDPEQVSKKQNRRKKIESLVDKIKINDDQNQGKSPQAILNKDLRAKLKDMEIRVLDAHQKVSKDLEEIEKHLTNKYENLQKSINQAKTLTKTMDDKINDTVLHVMKLAKTSADKAKSKVRLVLKAATALTDIEKRINANETRNVARVIKSRIAELPVNKFRSYQRILAMNNIITKMDGAKIIAENKANDSYTSRDEVERNMADIATNVLEELTSTEDELNKDTKVEIEDEKEAERKLEDAERRNYKVAIKSGEALKRIEGYLERLGNEEKILQTVKN